MQDAVEHLVTQFENGTLTRKQLIQGLLAAVAPSCRLAHAHADTSPTSTFRGRSLNHVTLSVGVENFSIGEALDKLRSEFPESKPIVYRGKELYFHDPDGILGQISGMDYGQRDTP